jgi:hypothetical protein
MSEDVKSVCGGLLNGQVLQQPARWVSVRLTVELAGPQRDAVRSNASTMTIRQFFRTSFLRNLILCALNALLFLVPAAVAEEIAAPAPKTGIMNGLGFSAGGKAPAIGLLSAAQSLSLLGSTRPEHDENPIVPASETLTSVQIVEQMVRSNQGRTEGLKHYRTVRHYQVEYSGFSARIAARMDVEVNYDASSGKRFRVLSQSGSKALCEKVLKRAVDSEQEAAKDKEATALTQANYKFDLTGSETLGGRPTYILNVEPLVANKFLYRGKIWVDAVDFALVKMEVEPARNPSFWISRTRIRQTYAKTGSFWLPEQNRSESKVRIGGTAVLLIDYGTYQTEPSASH